MNIKAIALFGQPAWAAYMKHKLEQRGLKAEVTHIIWEGSVGIYYQDDFGFDVDGIVQEFKKQAVLE